MPCDKRELLVNVEQVVIEMITSMITQDNITFKVPLASKSWTTIMDIKLNVGAPDNDTKIINFRKISYNSRRSRHRFCLVVYLLAEIHRLLVFGGSCTVRGLYYRDTQMIRSQPYIVAAKLDVCRMLNTSPAHLGILSASKGLISGDVQLIMSNGDVMDCNTYRRAITLPTDFENVERIMTNAELVLLVEKESVFESLLARNALTTFGLHFILLTGKGYPDYTTRRIVHRLSIECNLPVYILVDADPFGIDIMLVYQQGSQSMSFSSDMLSTPMIRWIGLHPSEIRAVSKITVTLTNFDNKKIVDILSRSNISLGVRQELRTLQHNQIKAEIESVIDFLGHCYIPTKINRSLFL